MKIRDLDSKDGKVEAEKNDVEIAKIKKEDIDHEKSNSEHAKNKKEDIHNAEFAKIKREENQKNAASKISQIYEKTYMRKIRTDLNQIKEYAHHVKQQKLMQKSYNAGLKIIIRVSKSKIRENFDEFNSQIESKIKKNALLEQFAKKLSVVSALKMKQNSIQAMHIIKEKYESDKIAQKQYKIGINQLIGLVKPKILGYYNKIQQYSENQKLIENQRKSKLTHILELSNLVILRQHFSKLRKFLEILKKADLIKLSNQNGAKIIRQILNSKIRINYESLKSSIILKQLDTQKLKRKELAVKNIILRKQSQCLKPYFTKWLNFTRNEASQDLKTQNANRLYKSLNNIYKIRLQESLNELSVFVSKQKLIEVKNAEITNIINTKDSEYQAISEQHMKNIQEKESEIRKARLRELVIKLRTNISQKLKFCFDQIKVINTTSYLISESIDIPPSKEEPYIQNEPIVTEELKEYCEENITENQPEPVKLEPRKKSTTVLLPKQNLENPESKYDLPRSNNEKLVMKPNDIIYNKQSELNVSVEAWDKPKEANSVHVSVEANSKNNTLISSPDKSPEDNMSDSLEQSAKKEDRFAPYKPKDAESPIPKLIQPIYIDDGNLKNPIKPDSPTIPNKDQNQNNSIDSLNPENSRKKIEVAVEAMQNSNSNIGNRPIPNLSRQKSETSTFVTQANKLDDSQNPEIRKRYHGDGIKPAIGQSIEDDKNNTSIEKIISQENEAKLKSASRQKFGIHSPSKSQDPPQIIPTKRRKYKPAALAKFMTNANKAAAGQNPRKSPREPFEPDTQVHPLRTQSEQDFELYQNAEFNNEELDEKSRKKLSKKLHADTYAVSSDTGMLDFNENIQKTPNRDQDTNEKMRKLCAEMLNTPDTFQPEKSRISNNENDNDNSAIGMAEPIELEKSYAESKSENDIHRPKHAKDYLPVQSRTHDNEQDEEDHNNENMQFVTKAGRYDHKRFMQAFSECFVKYHDEMIEEELNAQKGTRESLNKSSGRLSRGISPSKSVPKIIEPSPNLKFRESPILQRSAEKRTNVHKTALRFNSARETLAKASSEKELRDLLTNMNDNSRSKCILAGCVSGPDISKTFKQRLNEQKKSDANRSRFIRSNIQMVRELSRRVSSQDQGSLSPKFTTSIGSTRLGRTMGVVGLQSSVGSLSITSRIKDKSQDRNSGNNFININKKFIKEMSTINHEINSQYTCLAHVPRFKVPKPDLVFQLTKYKVHIQSRSVMTKINSSDEPSVFTHSPLETHEKLKFMNLTQSQGYTLSYPSQDK